jgi:crotonobetainyl-CoA hydratase
MGFRDRESYHIAMDMLLTGRWLDVEEAHRWGFVNEILPADRSMKRAWEPARLLENEPPLAYAAIKEAVRSAEVEIFQTTMNSRAGGRTLFQRGPAGRRARLYRKARSG